MKYTNEAIAWAAGFCTTNEGTDFCLDVDAEFQEWMRMPSWPDDPGACATWLLPVLEKRWPGVMFSRELGAGWSLFKDYNAMLEERRLAGEDEWHATVIEAIMATALAP